MSQILAIFKKELKSEFKTRASAAAVALFILTTVTISAISVAHEKLSPELYSGLLWIILFFSAMTGLSKVFVAEVDRGTDFLLRISAKPGAIYFGKLIFNTLFSFLINLLAVVLYMLFINPQPMNSPGIFFISIVFISISLSAATTIISALISRAGGKNSLFAVLSFPVLLPLVVIGMELVSSSFIGTSFGESINNINLLIAYSGILITVSSILFDFVWTD